MLSALSAALAVNIPGNQPYGCTDGHGNGYGDDSVRQVELTYLATTIDACLGSVNSALSTSQGCILGISFLNTPAVNTNDLPGPAGTASNSVWMGFTVLS